jgi:hypothetical protein
MKREIKRPIGKARGKVDQVVLSQFLVTDPGFRRHARAPMCIR